MRVGLKKENMMKKGILFDLDGTLWDSAQAVVNSWNEILVLEEDTREITLEEMQGYMGKTMLEIAYDFFKDCSKARAEELLEKCVTRENEYVAAHGGILFEKVKETLGELHKDYHLSIVSNCQQGYIPAFLHYYQLEEVIDDYEEYGRTMQEKKDNIALVVKRNHLEKAVYVGDTLGDYRSATAAGVPFIHAAYGFGKDLPKDVDKILTFEDLLKKETLERYF